MRFQMSTLMKLQMFLQLIKLTRRDSIKPGPGPSVRVPHLNKKLFDLVDEISIIEVLWKKLQLKLLVTN